MPYLMILYFNDGVVTGNGPRLSAPPAATSEAHSRKTRASSSQAVPSRQQENSHRAKLAGHVTDGLWLAGFIDHIHNIGAEHHNDKDGKGQRKGIGLWVKVGPIS